METKIKNLLARLAFFAEDGMAEPPIVAIAKDADALLKEMCRAQPEPVNQQQAGVYHKFNVSRTDGRDQHGGDRHGAEYFVLDVTHDKFAKPALAAYAAACRNDYPALADDMVSRYGIAQQQAEPVALEPVEGDLLPAIGDTVLIHLSRPDGWFPHRVVGYYVWGSRNGSNGLYRVFVRVVDAQGYQNARPLDAIRHLGEETAMQPAVAEGCGACGDGCKGQGCRLERESPPTCQTCNGHGMIGGLLPNGGGYDGEPCPDCTPKTCPPCTGNCNQGRDCPAQKGGA